MGVPELVVRTKGTAVKNEAAFGTQIADNRISRAGQHGDASDARRRGGTSREVQ